MENLRQMLWTLIVFVVIKMQDIAAETDQGNVFYQHGEFPKDCQDVKDSCTENENRVNGVYLIRPEGYEEPFEVFCDHESDGGGWTVFQRRQDNTINFARPWQYYKEGFGFLSQEFWLGNDKLAYLTNQKKYVLRIDFKRNGREWVQYNHYQITDEKGHYRLVKLGEFTSSSRKFKERMGDQVGMRFSTHDNFTSECANVHGAGGWWFSSDCRRTNLNGDYNSEGWERLHWQNDKPDFSEMKIKPAEFV